MTTTPPRLHLERRDPLWLRVGVASFMLLYKVVPWHWIPTEADEPTVNLWKDQEPRRSTGSRFLRWLLKLEPHQALPWRMR